MEVARRLSAGLSVDFEKVKAGHPDLLPELSDELKLQELTHRQFLAAQRAGPVPNDTDPGPVNRRGLPGGITPAPVPFPDVSDPTSDAHAAAAAAATAATAAHPDAMAHPAGPPHPAAAAPPAPAVGPADAVAVVGGPEIAVRGYQVLPALKQGGQATVFRAVHQPTGRVVALKVIGGGPLLTRRHQSRFDREAKILARLRHPNIVGILDRGRTADGLFYLTMDFVDGPELDEWVAALPRAAAAGDAAPEAAGPVDVESDGIKSAGDVDAAGFVGARTGLRLPVELTPVLRLFARVCDAVGEAHAQGVVHRDLKPSNIRVDRRRGEPFLLDFGLARLTAAEPGEEPADLTTRFDVTRTGQVVGSFPWLSPEQATGVGGVTVDARSDVYALGVMLYESITGVPPYPRYATLGELLNHIQHHTPEPPGRVRPDVPPAVDAVVMTALAKAPADRYPNAGAMARDLWATIAGEPVAAAPYRRPVGWRRPAAAAAAAVVVAGLGIWFAAMARRPAGPSGSGNASVPPSSLVQPPTTGPVPAGVVPPIAAKPTPTTLALPVRQDTYVSDGPFYKVPLGNEEPGDDPALKRRPLNLDEGYRFLYVSHIPGPAGEKKAYNRDAYLQFDLAAIPPGAAVRSARLRLFGQAIPHKGWADRARRAKVSAFKIEKERPGQESAEKWDEQKVTWPGRPVLVSWNSSDYALGSVDVVVGPPAWWEVDLTQFVAAERAEGRTLATVGLHIADTVGDTFARFDSSEAEHPPALAVTYER